MKRPYFFVAVSQLLMFGILVASGGEVAGLDPCSANPILPGYFADPSIVQYQGHEYIYATLDPWGGDTLGCWESPDFKHWTYRVLNWPTKRACTSPTLKSTMIWAPSVVRAPDGKFFMYVPDGSEIRAGRGGKDGAARKYIGSETQIAGGTNLEHKLPLTGGARGFAGTSPWRPTMKAGCGCKADGLCVPPKFPHRQQSRPDYHRNLPEMGNGTGGQMKPAPKFISL
jgi:hypothetical protein